jgi:hypothetical protein
MSETDGDRTGGTDALAAAMALQRRSVESGREAIHRGAETEKLMARMTVDGADAGRAMGREGTSLARSLAHATTDTMAMLTPGNAASMRGVREAVDDGFDAAERMNDQTWDAIHEAAGENAEAFEAFVDGYLETVDRSYDELLAAYDEARPHESAGDADG